VVATCADTNEGGKKLPQISAKPAIFSIASAREIAEYRGVQALAVLNIVGLSSRCLGDAMPRLSALRDLLGLQSFAPAFPAITCTAQSHMLTGTDASQHGIVANGWLDRESAEVRFWKQSNRLVRGEKIWHRLQRELPGFTCANLFWWYNMATDADIAITPRPLYLSDGRKHFDIHTQPMPLREAIKADLGDFPFPSFWGPAAGIACSQWIAKSARWVYEKHQPSLNLVYLPHLDYGLQKFGPDAPEMAQELSQIDAVAGELIDFYESKGVRVLIVSEYGISPVSQPVHLNRVLRDAGLLSIKDELGRDGLDLFQSEAIAVADHQIAHIYVKDAQKIATVQTLLAAVPGVAKVQLASEVWQQGIAQERAGDLIVTANADAWFTYYFWNDDSRAPDFARCVDIHRKPGYDPVELFLDPTLCCPKLKIAAFLLKKKLGLRALLDVIPLDATLVKGSHGRTEVPSGEQAIVIGARQPVHKAEDIFAEMLSHFLDQ
jgi:predicted AlkP superfamily pyrophosphatase or phosphodiesterase